MTHGRRESMVCIVLAAGRGSRFGRAKSGLSHDGVLFADRALLAARGYETIVVGHGDDDTLRTRAQRHGARFVRNDEPTRGMVHSLRLALEVIAAPHASIAILLVDTPLVDADVVARVVAASSDVDIAYPIDAAGRPGHPVVMSARTRQRIATLPEGDTLRLVRDDPAFSRRTVPFQDARPFVDVDVAADLTAIDNEAARCSSSTCGSSRS